MEKEEELRLYREERARQYAKAEEDAIARGDYEEVFVEEWKCDICKKIFKKEAQLINHLGSKKHKQAEAKLRKEVGLDDATELLIQ